MTVNVRFFFIHDTRFFLTFLQYWYSNFEEEEKNKVKLFVLKAFQSFSVFYIYCTFLFFNTPFNFKIASSYGTIFLDIFAMTIWYLLNLLVLSTIEWLLFNTTFNNISVISWRSVLLMEDTGGPGVNNWPAVSHRQTLLLNVVHLAWAGFELTTLVVICTDYTGSYKSNHHTITTTRWPLQQ